MKDRNWTPFPILRTERLTLRQIGQGDAHEILVLRSNAQVNQYLDRKPATSHQEAEAFITGISESIQRSECLYWGIALIGCSQMVGSVCLFNLSENKSKAEIGFELLPEFHQKGIMREAVDLVIRYAMNEIAVDRIEANVHFQNNASINLLKNLGFRGCTGEGPVLRFERSNK